uniref:Uncharacterized protein n=1 Tax=Escherichia coli TaxID=562 RepID=A0A2H5MH09_ECOLX|nr:hypothetical protein [Escherichia coli]
MPHTQIKPISDHQINLTVLKGQRGNDRHDKSDTHLSK